MLRCRSGRTTFLTFLVGITIEITLNKAMEDLKVPKADGRMRERLDAYSLIMRSGLHPGWGGSSNPYRFEFLHRRAAWLTSRECWPLGVSREQFLLEKE